MVSGYITTDLPRNQKDNLKHGQNTAIILRCMILNYFIFIAFHLRILRSNIVLWLASVVYILFDDFSMFCICQVSRLTLYKAHFLHVLKTNLFFWILTYWLWSVIQTNIFLRILKNCRVVCLSAYFALFVPHPQCCETDSYLIRFFCITVLFMFYTA